MVSTDYKIVGFDQARGQISVKFDELPYTIPVDLHTNEQGLYPEGEALNQHIRSFCPIGNIQREKTLSQGVINSNNIAELVEPLVSNQMDSEQDESLYLSPEEKLDIYIEVVVQRVIAQMVGATI